MRTFLPFFIKFLKIFTVIFCIGNVSILFIKWNLYVKLNLSFEPFTEKIIWGILYSPFVYFIFNKLFIELDFQTRQKILLFIEIPFLISFSGNTVADSFIVKHYSIVSVEKPSDIIKLPKERFFKINKFEVLPHKYFLVMAHSSKGNGSQEYGNYYIAPVYDDLSASNSLPLSKIAYGVSFTKTLVGIGATLTQPNRIRKQDSIDFCNKSEIDYNLYDFKNVDYFEKLSKSSVGFTYFIEAWNRNPSFDNIIEPIIIVKRSGTITELIKADSEFCFWTIVITYLLAIVSFCLSELTKNTI